MTENNPLENLGVPNNLELIPGKTVELPNPLLASLPQLPEKVGDLFPAVTHEYIANRGRIHDAGWQIKWFKEELEAKENNEKYQKEAESFYLTKDFFEKLEKTEDRKIPEIIYPDIDPNKLERDDIMQYGGIEKYRFVGKATTLIDSSLDGYKYKDSPSKLSSVYHDFLIEDGELLISVEQENWGWHDNKHFYEVAIKNGANKEALDRKIINGYNLKAQEIKEKIKDQFEAIDFGFMKNYNHLPKLMGKDVELEEAIAECRNQIFINHDIDNIDEYWEVKAPSRYIIDKLNTQFIKWDHFWQGSFDHFNKMIEKKEVLANYGGHFRRGGNTGCQDNWVIRPNGDIRTVTSIKYRKDYFSEGEKNWDVVLPEEIAISWSKYNTGAEHEFVIDKMPQQELTPAQKQGIQKIQDGLAEDWQDRTGMSGNHSPEIGAGWFAYIDREENIDTENNDDGEESDEVMAAKLQALKDKFKK